MTAERKTLIRIAEVIAALGLGALPVAGAAPQSDISRIAAVVDQLPPGFTVEVRRMEHIGPADIDTLDSDSLAGSHIDPPQCRQGLQSFYSIPGQGSDVVEITADADQASIDILAVRSATPVAITELPGGCEHIIVSGDPDTAGVVERLAAPTIPRASTAATRIVSDQDPEDPDYVFIAELDEQTVVVVAGRVDPDLGPVSMLTDLLTKSVIAVQDR